MSKEEEKEDAGIKSDLVPDKPVIGKVTNNSVEVSWSIPPISYCLQQRVEKEGPEFKAVYEGDNLKYMCTAGIKLATKYEYRLKAFCGGAHSQWSDVLTVETKGYSESTPGRLCEAINNENYTAVKSLLNAEPGCVNPLNYECGSSYSFPLMEACKIGSERIVEDLLSYGADVEHFYWDGTTSLMKACYYGHNKCALLLLESKASWWWQRCDSKGRSALHWAVEGEHLDTVKLLLEKGSPADIVDQCQRNLSGFTGNTPLLSLAAGNGNADIARELILHGADINRRNANGQTPLKLACLGRHGDLVKVLLVENKCDQSGLTALENSFCLEVQRDTELADAISVSADGTQQ